jgi:Proton-conducting membrane transporter
MNRESLLLAAVALPAALLLACVSAQLRKVVSRVLWVASIPGLAASLFSARNVPLALSGAPYQMTLRLDGPGSMLLTAASLLWIAAGFYAPAFFRERGTGGSFTVCWLFTLIGSLGIFLAADLASFLLFYALVSLPAYGLITYDGTGDARRAGAIYMGFALLGENLLLMGFVLLALNVSDGSLMISDVVAALQNASSRGVILSLLIAGFGMKIALLPMHFWMPLSYTAAPIPATAALSGAAVKAGVIGLIRFLPFDMALSNWGILLTTVGLCGAFYGFFVGITQSNPKTVLAYSSVSQMGFLAAVLGMGLFCRRRRSRFDCCALWCSPHFGERRVVPRGGSSRRNRSAPHGRRPCARSGDRAWLGGTSAHRRRPGQAGSEGSARLWARRHGCDLVGSRNGPPDAAFSSAGLFDSGARSPQGGSCRACRAVARHGGLLRRRPLGVLFNGRARIPLRRPRSCDNLEDALAGAGWHWIVHRAAALVQSAAGDTERKCCGAGRRSVACCGGLRSGDYEGGWLLEALDDRLHCAACDYCRPSGGDARQKLKPAVVGFSRFSAGERSSQGGLNVHGQRRLRGLLRPGKTVPHHVVKSASLNILALQAAREKIGPRQPFAKCKDPVPRHQIIVPPTTAVQTLAVPTHRRDEGFDQPKHLEKATIQPANVAADRGEVCDVRTVPGASQWMGDQPKKIRDSEPGWSFEAGEA